MADRAAGPSAPPQTGSSQSRRPAPERDGGGGRHAGARPAVHTDVDPAVPTDPALAQEQGGRGSLELADKVLTKIAQRAALEVEGVAPAEATTGRLGGVLGGVTGGAVGGGYPDADVEHAGTRARVTLEIAATWPYPASRVAAEVRDRVVTRLRELAAVEADSVSVHVAAVVPATPTRRQERVR